jgi:hypothetical protein
VLLLLIHLEFQVPEFQMCYLCSKRVGEIRVPVLVVQLPLRVLPCRLEHFPFTNLVAQPAQLRLAGLAGQSRGQFTVVGSAWEIQLLIPLNHLIKPPDSRINMGKSEKKSKKTVTEVVAMDVDVSVDGTKAEGEGPSYEDRLKAASEIAHPMASKKLTRKVLKTVKKGNWQKLGFSSLISKSCKGKKCKTWSQGSGEGSEEGE